MNIQIKAGPRCGTVSVPASKSCAHRALICAALAREPGCLMLDSLSEDLEATVRCLRALGAAIRTDVPGQLLLTPLQTSVSGIRHLYCGESGSTLRFLLPVAGALGACAVFHMEGTLPERPLGALLEVLCAHGMHIEKKENLLFCSGRLTAGSYSIVGNISSQFVSGLLFALPLLSGESTLEVTGSVESADYITLTETALREAGIRFEKQGFHYTIPGSQRCLAPKGTRVEADWSSAAGFLCMGALSEAGVCVKGLSLCSGQGDREILNILRRFGAVVEQGSGSVRVSKGRLVGQEIDAAAIPDLIPAVSALAAGAEGRTRIFHAERLRFKESDRLQTTAQMLRSLGADVTETNDGLLICGKTQLAGGTAASANDHRIAMAAVVAAGFCRQDVIVLDAQCVRKSYPGFWNDFETLQLAAEPVQGCSIEDKKTGQICRFLRSAMCNLVLIGMPGCGKSSIARRIGAETGRPVFDSDDEITRRTGRKPSQIVQEQGEDAFRAIESAVLSDLGKQSGAVIATGGGAVMREENYAALHQNGCIVWLRRDLASLATADRPLSQKYGLEALYAVREPLYRRFADVIVDLPSDTLLPVSSILDAARACMDTGSRE